MSQVSTLPKMSLATKEPASNRQLAWAKVTFSRNSRVKNRKVA
jgi:hypothetical protein